MARNKPEPVRYPTELVLQAACVAQRINGKYISIASRDGQLGNGDLIRSNANIVRGLLGGQEPFTVTDEDRQLAESVRTYYQSLTLKLLTEDHISEFDRTCMDIANGDQVPQYLIGQAAYMPCGYQKWQQTQLVDERLFDCRPQHVAAIGSKVKLEIQPVKAVFSKNYGCYFYTAITNDNLVVSFASSSSKFQVGATYQVTAKVKAHLDDHRTKLNYVKIS